MAAGYREYNPEQTHFTMNLRYCQVKEFKVYLPRGRGESGAKQRDSETIESRDCRLEDRGENKEADLSRRAGYGGNRDKEKWWTLLL